VFFYDSFPGTRDMLGGHGIRLHALTTWRDVLAVSRTEKFFDDATLDTVESFLRDPVSWSKSHGGGEPEAAS
jgi:orotate phosphoribosyltransferase